MPTRTTRALDARGRTVSTYVAFDVNAELEGMEPDEAVELLIDDYEALVADMHAWSAVAGHAVLESGVVPEGYRFVIEKGAGSSGGKALAMVLSTDGLEETLSPLAFTLAAALEGIEVHLYLQGPGVHLADAGFRAGLTGWWRRPFSRFAAAGMSRSGHIAAQDKLRQLRQLGGNIYLCGPSVDRFKVREPIFDDLPKIEYLTFMSLMAEADIHVFS